jgi:hypothetical protein
MAAWPYAEEHGAGPSGPPSGYAPRDVPDNWPPPYRVWVSGDFLVWKIRSAPLPPLAATVPFGLLQVTTQNVIENTQGQVIGLGPPTTTLTDFRLASTSTLAGGNSVNLGEQFGGRFTVGAWLDPEESLGLEGTAFFITRRTDGFNSTTGNSINQSTFALPATTDVFVQTTTITTTNGTTQTTTTNTLVNSFTAFIVRQATNEVVGTASTEMWGAELNARCASPSLGAVSGLVGFRYLDFRENLQIHDSTQLFLPAGFSDTNQFGLPLDTNLPTNLTFTTADVIRTHNNFYGGQIGLDLDMYVGRLFADIRAKAALGVMNENVNIFGVSALPTGGVAPGGLLSSPLDQGSHSRNQIAFVPEINVKVGYQLLPSLRAYVGYDFLWLSNVVRPGDQTGISSSGVTATVAGTTQQIAVSQPSFRFKTSDVTINGINFGLEFRY